MLNRSIYTQDAMTAAMGFVIAQTARVNTTVYEIKYEDVRYRGNVFIDSEGPEWVDSILYTSSDAVGRAEWLNPDADDVPKVELMQNLTGTTVHEAGIGYDWTEKEIQRSMQLGIPLKDRKARAARQAAEQMIDRLIWSGDPQKGMTGIINAPIVPKIDAAATGTGSSTFWKDKTPGQILSDVNNLLQGIYVGTGRTSTADTLLLPTDAHLFLASTLLPDGGGQTLLDWIAKTNLYTTGSRQQLNILALPELNDAGPANVGRAVAYRKAREVVCAYMPMPFRFYQPWQTGPWRWDVPGLFRFGGVEWFLPKEGLYMDGVSP